MSIVMVHISLGIHAEMIRIHIVHQMSSKPAKDTSWHELACVSGQLLEKYLNLEGFLEKSLKIKSALECTEKPLKSLEKSLNSTIFCRTLHS